MTAKDVKRILYINPDSSDRLNDVHKEFLDKYTTPGYKADVTNITYGGELGTCFYYFSVATPYIVEQVLRGEKEGYDAVIVSCFGNPAVKEAREVVRIPVIGAGEAALHLGCLLGDTLSIVTTGARIRHKNLELNEKYHHEFYVWIRRDLRVSGLADRIASIRTTGTSLAGGIAAFVDKDPDEEVRELLDQGKKAIEQDGADVLILGCTGMIGVADTLQEKLGVPVVDPTLAALKIAETLVSMNLTHSSLAYPFTSVEADRCPITYPPTLKGYQGYRV